MSKKRREKQKKARAKAKANKMVNASKGLDLTKLKETTMFDFQEALKKTLK